MVNPITSGNGIIPITCAPPEDVPPTTPGYSMSIGVTELTSPTGTIPTVLLEEGLTEYPVTYSLQEYALILQGDDLVRLPLSGLTIDWAASDIQESGSLLGRFGVTVHYDLVGKPFNTFQYTYLEFSCILVENGVPKSASWNVRMKHF
jgi:hypothetical protein